MSRSIITQSEYEVMKVLWKSEEALSLGEIMSRLDAQWSRNTVGTLLVRLNEKNVIATQKQGKANLYYPVLKEEEYSITETKSLLSKLYEGSVGNLVAALYNSKELSEKEVEELRKIING